jgi:Domain of unknown function (DUF4157)
LSLARSSTRILGPNHHANPILHLQRATGNQTKLTINKPGDEREQVADVREEMKSDPTSPSVAPALSFDFTRIPVTAPPIQRKPTISSPGDAFEREADDVADKVMRMVEPTPISSAPAAIQRKCAECEAEEKKTIQTKPTPSAHTGAALDAGAAVRAAEQGGGPLPREVRSYFEPRFGHDFSRVRVHADSDAADGARAVRARAYTVGRDIVFGSGEYAPATIGGKRLLAHELTHVVQQESASAAGQRPLRSVMVPFAPGAPMIQRKEECNLDPIEKECAGAATACLTAKDYCKTKYPNPKDIDKLHADAVRGANGYKEKFPNAADNLLHFLAGSGKEKVMNIDIFRNHPATQQKYGEHMAKFKAGALKRYESGELKIGGPAVEMVWTDTANAFTPGEFTDLGLAVGGYTLCSKVSATAKDPKEVGGSKDFLWVRFDPWTTQAFDCYNWDPGKGIGLPFATDNDFCCLENAGRAKHFRIRTDPWPLVFPIEAMRISPEKPPTKPPTSPPPKP